MFRVIKRRTACIQGYYRPERKKEHRTEWILYLIFLSGLVLGAWFVRQNGSMLQKLFILFENYTAVQAAQTAIIHFSNAFFKQLLLLLITYIFGVCAVGVPFLYAVPLCYGAGIGTISAYLYMQYALKGIGYCALLLYPGYIISVVSTICACGNGIKMSESILKGLLQIETAESFSYKKLNLQYLILVIVAAGGALLDSVLFRIFSGYFQFS